MDGQMALPHPSPEGLRLALVSMPWPLFNRPSIQLGTLKAHLERQAGGWLQVDLFHPYLAVARLLGPDLYHWVSQNPWVCEALYAPLLFPDQEPQAAGIVARAARRASPPVRLDFPAVRQKLAGHLHQWLSATDWDRYHLIGFSVCFNQLFSSLTAASGLKQNFPDCRIAIGGSFCAPSIATSLLATFPALDFAISGEGEQPLLRLCHFLAGREATLPAAVFTRAKKRSCSPPFDQLPDLSKLATPDYRDYFAEMGREFAGDPFIPVLPVEFSRGCWWNKCAFCNLNVQWCGYRAKKANHVQEEVFSLSEQFGCLDFAFTDNALPPKEAQLLFKSLGAAGRDLRFFGEIRVQHLREDLDCFRRGGLETVQAGIEALSNTLLQKMAKGVSVLDNIAAMKYALAAGMMLEGNLITEFPGSTDDEIEETLRNLDYVLPFPALTAARFFLGHGSPVDRQPGSYGLKAVIPHPQYARLFPRQLIDHLDLLVKDYRGDRTVQHRQWKPVVRKVREWQRFHARRKEHRHRHRPALGYRDGGGFLLIRQELTDRTLHHRLRGLSREIYLFCEEVRDLEEIGKRFPTLTEEKLRAFCNDLTGKLLMFSENNRYLSLAIKDH
jgi:ribosomal peptide maturation radical SAM protein 1